MKIKKNIPNILSSIRLLSPFVLTPLIIVGNYLGAIIALSGFLLTDAFDGFLARKWHVESDLGSKIDVVADKVIILSLILPMIAINKTLVATILMEAGISSVNMVRKFRKGNPKTLQIGRIKMIILSFFIALNYLNIVMPISKIIIDTLFFITLLFQGLTLDTYFNELKIEEKRRLINDIKIAHLKENIKNKKQVIKEDIIKKNDLSQNLINQKEELLDLNNEIINNDAQNKIKKLSKKKQ